MSQLRRAACGAALLAVALATARGQDPTPPSAASPVPTPPTPDLAAFRAAGARTQARLEREAARWTIAFTTRQRALLEVEVLRTPFATRRTLALRLPDRPAREVLRVIEREGAWYVSEVGGARGVYAPRGAPFAFSRAYRFLDAARLPLPPEDLGRSLGPEGSSWAFRRPLPPLPRHTLERLVESLRGAPPEQRTPQLEARLRQALRALEEGERLVLDPETGLLSEFGPPDLRGRLVAFRWLELSELDLGAFATEGEVLPDRRAAPPLPVGEQPSWVQLAHAGHWRAGSRGGDLDLREVELHTGQVRRPPLDLSLALPGPLLPGGARLVRAFDDHGLGLFRAEPDGRSRRLGGSALRSGSVQVAAVDSGARRVAALHVADEERGLAQLTILDLDAPERVERVGVPFHAGETLSWYPDGSAVLVSRRERFLPDAPPYAAVTKLHLRGGRFQELRRGDSPVFVAGDRIAYLDKQGAWQTCRSDGTDPRPIGDGLRDHSQPAPSPDGQRLLLLRETEAGPRPVLVELASGAVTPLPTEEPLRAGLWLLPGWGAAP